MGKKGKVIIMGVLVMSLVIIYLGKNYGANKKDKSINQLNVIENLNDAKEGIPTIITFKTTTCPYCTDVEKSLTILASKYPDKFNIYYASLEDYKNESLAMKFSVRVVPTTAFIDKAGKVYYIHEGLLRESEIENLLNSLGVK